MRPLRGNQGAKRKRAAGDENEPIELHPRVAPADQWEKKIKTGGEVDQKKSEEHWDAKCSAGRWPAGPPAARRRYATPPPRSHARTGIPPPAASAPALSAPASSSDACGRYRWPL